jgi:hypothetical protein
VKDQNRANARAQNTSSDRKIVAIPVSWLVGGLAIILAPWIVAGAIYLEETDAADDPEARVAMAGPTTTASRGPWGRLSKTPIIVSPPLEYVAADWGRDEGPYQWYFPGTSPDVLRTFLASTGLTAEQVTQLVAHARPEPRISGITLRPDLELLRSLDPQVRARLYLRLAKSQMNADQANSFRFFGNSPDAWLDGAPINPDTRALVESLIYRDGGIMHFADAEIVRQQITDKTELQRLAKTLLRQPTMLVRLTVDRSSEINQLAQYWGIGGRSTDIRPLLESVAGAGEQGSIDIVHLLPAFARNRLYRYPKLTTADLNKPALANCLWTALNFFSTEPDDRYLELNTAIKALQENYYIVESNYQLGDIIALLDGEGDLFHVVVYIADDLVFTKNGTSPVAPWTIMPLDHVKDYYRNMSANPRLIYHRRNDL